MRTVVNRRFFSSTLTLLDTFLFAHSDNIFYAQATHGTAK